MELRLKSLTSLAKLGKAAERDPAIRKAYCDPVQPVLDVLKEKFKMLQWQEESVKVQNPADEEALAIMQLMLKLPDADVEDAVSKIDGLPQLKQFIDKHCRSRHYTFQVKKCSEPDCAALLTRSSLWY